MTCQTDTSGNVRLAWAFPCDETSGGQVLTATSESGNMLKENLVNHQPSIVWRSTSAATQIITGQFSEAEIIRFLLLYDHNLSNGAQVRLELAKDSLFAGIVFDKTCGYNYSSSGYGLYPYGLYPYGYGKRIGGEGYNPFLLEFFENSLSASYYRVTITDTTNPDVYIQIGRMAMGDYWSPSYNVKYGYGMQRQNIPSSGNRMSRAGSTFRRKRPNYRTATMDYQWLTAEDERQLELVKHEAGDYYNVLFSAYPGTGGDAERRHVLLGFVNNSSAIKRTGFDYREMNLTIMEAK